MKDIRLMGGKRILLIEQDDLDRTHGFVHQNQVRSLVNVSRAFYDVIIINIPSSRGLTILPKWLREFKFRVERGEQGGSYWILEKDEREVFV